MLASEKVRWSLHTVRTRLAKKQQYCQFFTRFGECKKSGGRCPYIHDRAKVAICTKFVKGLCSNNSCKLTHKVKFLLDSTGDYAFAFFHQDYLSCRSFPKECQIVLTFCKVIHFNVTLLFIILWNWLPAYMYVWHPLAGLCTNTACPYRHVKVNSKAPVCEDFLKGYCADGDEVFMISLELYWSLIFIPRHYLELESR